MEVLERVAARVTHPGSEDCFFVLGGSGHAHGA
jgi:hypothetical protein